MNSLDNDMVLWAAIICVVGAILVISWLFYMAFRNATKDKDEK